MKQEKLLVMQMKADYSQQHKENKYMSKAILVMDMPDSCFHCDCCHEKPMITDIELKVKNFVV